MATDFEQFLHVFEIWQHQRTEVFKRSPFGDGGNASSLREFVEIQNRLAKQLVSLTRKTDPEFWTAVSELGVHCQTVVSGAKTKVNHIDRTQEGM